MAIWKASSIEETPELELVGGKIYEVSSELWEGRTRHFSGYNITEHEGRCSSAIVEFDKDKMVGRTESGRIYKLLPEKMRFSQAGDAAYVWDWYVNRNKLTDIKDVTDEYVNRED